MSKTLGLPWQRLLAEFLVIFAGITLSLAADDWWQDRSDAKREVEIIQGILSDLQEDSDELSNMIARANEWDQASRWLQRNRGDAEMPVDSALGAIRPLFFTYRYQPVRSAYLSLLNSGDLALVQERALREQIVNYYERRQAYIVAMAAVTNEYATGFVDATKGILLWAADNPEATSMRDEESGAGFRLLQPWASGSVDPDFVFEATRLGIWGATLDIHFTRALEENRSLGSEISAYLRG